MYRHPPSNPSKVFAKWQNKNTDIGGCIIRHHAENRRLIYTSGANQVKAEVREQSTVTAYLQHRFDRDIHPMHVTTYLLLVGVKFKSYNP